MSRKVNVKRKRSTDDTNINLTCVVHYQYLREDTEITPLSQTTYSTLLKNKDIRHQLGGGNAHFEQCNSIPVPTFDPKLHGFHRKCYQKFTKAKTIVRKSESPPGSSDSSRHHRRQDEQSTSKSVLFPITCGICNKYSIKIKGKKQFPTKIVTETAEVTLKMAAELHKDHAMLTKIQTEDLRAKEFCKHEKCYTSYTKITRGRDQSKHTVSSDEEDEDDSLNIIRYGRVCHVVEENILQNHQAVSMETLNEMCCVGAGDRRYRYKLKERLKGKYGDSLLFVTVHEKQPQLVISAESLTGGVSVNKLLCMEDGQILNAAASLLRQTILNFVDKVPPLQWPPTVESLLCDERQPPETLVAFFSRVLKNPKNTDSGQVDKLSKSYSEDLVHGVTRGKFLTAKHVLLGVGIHHMTGKKLPVNVLYNLGHSSSYDQVCEIETAFAELSQFFQEQSQLLPLQPRLESSVVLTVFWMDNFDQNIETVTGHGTIHNTHGVAYQEMSEESISREDSVTLPRSKKRAIVSSRKELSHHSVNPKKEPLPFKGIAKSVPPELLVDTYKARLMLWKLCREAHKDDQIIPRYAGWLTLVSSEKEQPKRTVITYLPPIHQPITEYDTVVEYLTQAQEMAKQVNMPYVHLTLDVGAATKAYHVLWNFPDHFQNVIIHLGDFHLFQENFGILGQFVSGSGFEDIVFQAGLCASGSMRAVLAGKHYNRAWTVHEHFADALERLVQERFLQHMENLDQLPPCLVNIIRSEPQPIAFESLMQHEDIIGIHKLYEDFRQQLRSGKLGKTPQFWIMYLDMVDCQLMLHTAIKENNFNIRLLSWKGSLPLFFAFNKQNYARYGSFYVQTLETLDATHPGAKQLIEKQGISVQRSNHKASRQAVDQAGEQTYNRSAKIPGGIKQFAANKSAYDKWVLNRPHLAKFRDALLEITGLDSSGENPKKCCRPSEIIKSEQRVQSILSALENEFLNPFSEHLDTERLYNLSSGAPVLITIEQSLTSVIERGTKMYEEFVKERLESGQKKLFAPISRVALKTFKDSSQKVKVPAKGKVAELVIERDILGKLVALSNKHGTPVDIDRVLTYCLGPVPLCLSNTDGTRRTTCKSKLLEVISEYCPTLESSQLPPKQSVSAYIVDLMAMVRLLTRLPETFGGLAIQLLNLIPKGYQRVDVVADTYQEQSIKGAERQRRGYSEKYMIKGPRTKIPVNFAHFLSNGSNKESLIDIIVQVWTDQCSALENGQQIYFSRRERCVLITREGVAVVDDLCSNQEEADTKICLHVQHAMVARLGPVIIRSASGDTDIPVLLLALFPKCDADIFLDNGHGNTRKILQLTSCELTTPLKKALVGFHAFTGNDYVSAFFRKGKKSCWSILQKYPKFVDAFLQLGSAWEVENELLKLLEEFVCKLFGRKQIASVNLARQQIFWEKFNKKNTITDISLLPPCQECLELHSRRANFVSRLWRLSKVATLSAPHPKDHGWTEDWNIIWTATPFPNDVVDLLSHRNTSEDDSDLDYDTEVNDSSDDEEIN